MLKIIKNDGIAHKTIPVSSTNREGLLWCLKDEVCHSEEPWGTPVVILTILDLMLYTVHYKLIEKVSYLWPNVACEYTDFEYDGESMHKSKLSCWKDFCFSRVLLRLWSIRHLQVRKVGEASRVVIACYILVGAFSIAFWESCLWCRWNQQISG